MVQKHWFGVDVTVAPAASEAVESALNAMGAMGTATDSLRKQNGEPLVVEGFFEEPVSLEDVEDAIGEEFDRDGIDRDVVTSIEFKDVDEQDWLAEWKKHWTPTDVGPFVIAPPWADTSGIQKQVICIEPNMAFGTGTHETTQLCLEALANKLTGGMTVIDVGTGTGILAIAAAKLGSRHIRAFDTDADSVNIAAQNAQANGVVESIMFYEGTIDETTDPADLIVANLTLDVIKPMLPLLVEKSEIWLILSGILATQEQELRDTLRGCEVWNVDVKRSGEWIAVILGT
jgi:ribosomal protein L11 methyltransferase